jgi:hypothetical protein
MPIDPEGILMLLYSSIQSLLINLGTEISVGKMQPVLFIKSSNEEPHFVGLVSMIAFVGDASEWASRVSSGTSC